MTGVSNGTNERGVWCGGNDGSNKLNILEYITINSPGNTTDLGDLTAGRAGSGGASDGAL